MNLTKEQWHQIYKETLISYGVSEELAEETLQAAMEVHDYNEDPFDSALDELSYWDNG
jgi:hypothetical protein